ncbi:hypothetical protein J7F03_20360 [Streptomyces sp. ISL-43]|uniref:hypothetical protein n=1 Tax=Streptomyces sp. ISL-43 TaxID=2819183 RepID=UPI001BE66796|nr:hypothetical protein [Streptomyces sp. ISL-43]MBT2449402.1 hypothetical protein [Streptomyces sp. ISL-43]
MTEKTWDGPLVAGAIGYAVGGVGYGLAFWVHIANFDKVAPYRVAGNISTFAMLFVLALAIERLIQPFAPKLGPDSEPVRLDLEEKKRTANTTSAEIRTAEKKLIEARNATALIAWGVASAIGFLLAASSNITLLRSILDASTMPWYWLDLLLTGLVIGAGTKPLNDLVTRLERKS